MTLINPMEWSAPLPEDGPNQGIDWTDPIKVRDELIRAQVELMHAIAKHRTAWSKMAKMKKVAEARGNAYFMDNNRAWKIAVGDVTWWRGEVNARSNTILALIQLATLMGLDIGPKWAETTNLAEMGRGERSYVRAETASTAEAGGTARQLVYGWNRSTKPSLFQEGAARAWMIANNATMEKQGHMRTLDWELCVTLLRATAPPRHGTVT